MPQPRISIPKPCHEAWAAMMPTGQGRHCTACQKTVVDFSQKSSAEILEFLAQPGRETTCGRFRPAQVQPLYPRRLLTWPATPWVALSIVAVLTLTHCTPDKTPPAVPPTVVGGALLHGRVLDADSGQPLVGALIISEADTLCQTFTDADGQFSLRLPRHLQNRRLIAAMPTLAAAHDSAADYAMPYIPRYFEAATGATVLLRRPPLRLGQLKLLENETRHPYITPYLQRHGLSDAYPFPPKVLTP